MNQCSVCTSLPSLICGKAVNEILELVERLEEVGTDFKNWITRFKCKYCDQEWEEYYEAKGHANVPFVRKCIVQAK